MSLYEKMLAAEAERRGWTPEETNRWEKWRNHISYFEGKNNPKSKQIGGGPGRGKYQYEIKRRGHPEDSGHARTGRNRLKNYINAYLAKKEGDAKVTWEDLPESDRKELSKEYPEFNKISEEVQDMTYLADKSLADDTNLNALVSGEKSFFDAWRDWHWRGSDPVHTAKNWARWKREFSDSPANLATGGGDGYRAIQAKMAPEATDPVQEALASLNSRQAAQPVQQPVQQPIPVQARQAQVISPAQVAQSSRQVAQPAAVPAASLQAQTVPQAQSGKWWQEIPGVVGMMDMLGLGRR